MTDLFSVTFFATIFTTLIVILNPSGTAPAFLGLTSRITLKEQKRAALQAAAISVPMILTFAVLGQRILHLLHVSMGALKLSDGVLFSLVAVELLMSSDGEEPDTGGEWVNVTLVPLGTPLLAGPGVTVAIMAPIAQVNSSIVFWIGLVCAVAVAHFVMWATMHFSLISSRLLGPDGIVLLTKIMNPLFAMITTGLAMGGTLDLIAAT